ncbi:MAG: hypothetical protein Q8L80_07910 [Gallionella sp.]|nr:hypothetical protein [Gallionella sp.]
MNTDNEIIDAFGGTCDLALLCDVEPSAISQWRTNGIPKARLMYLKLLRPDLFATAKCTPKPPAEQSASEQGI